MENAKFTLEGPIKIEEETAERHEKASGVIKLPKGSKKQPDLMYFSAILVSSGENLNHAYFMGSELVSAHSTIINKALDVEHSEQDIIGHLYDRAFISKDGAILDLADLSITTKDKLDKQDLHIVVAGIIYKNRFPKIAEEVADNKWKVSMECYYTDYDVKIGNIIMSRKEAEAMGVANVKSTIGNMARVIKGGKEIAADTVARVLRGICFSGCGIVKNPANPPSIILETAEEVKPESKDEIIEFNMDKLEDNNLTSVNVSTEDSTENSSGCEDDPIGICIDYKRMVQDKSGNITQSNWCSMFNKGCTSFSRDTSDVSCLRNKEVQKTVTSHIKKLVSIKEANDRRQQLIDGIQAALREAVKTQSRINKED